MTAAPLDTHDVRAPADLVAALDLLRARGLWRPADVLGLLVSARDHLNVAEIHAQLAAYILDAPTT